MKTHLTVNLTTKTAKLNGSEWEPPVYTFGETATFALRFERDVEGTTVETSVEVEGFWAGIGEIDVQPARGDFALHIGEEPMTGANTTAQVFGNVSATELQAAINTLDAVTALYGAAKVVEVEGSYLIRFGSGAAAVPMQVTNNRLTPVAFGKIRARQIDGVWVHELRLVVAPVAFSSAAERVLPPPPSITRVQEGGSDGDVEWNEIQALYIPPEFRGTYQLKRDYRRTSLLSRADGPDEIQAAVAVFGETLAVSNPVGFVANIEFEGDFAGQSQELLEVVVFNAPEGDLTFDLPLDRYELAARFRSEKEVTLPLEVKLLIREDGKTKRVTAFRVDVTIRSEMLFSELAEINAINWLRPYSPKSYMPSDPSQVITGQQHYTELIGDGEATEIVVDHPLDTVLISSAAMYWVETGKALQAGVDYDWWRVAGADSVEIKFPTAPSSESVRLVLTSAGPKSAFVSDIEIQIAQVIGLEALLDNLGSRVSNLEEYLPSTGPSTPGAAGPGLVITVPRKGEVMFWPEAEPVLSDLPPRGPYLLPAVHTDDPSTALPSPLPDPSSVVTPTVYTNTGEAPVRLVVGGRVRDPLVPAIVLPGGYAACDGRSWYPVERDGESTSYYPASYNRFPVFFFVNGDQLGVGKALDFRFGVALQTVHATSRLTCVLEAQVGTAPEDTTPATPGPNLQNIVWRDEPLFRQRLVVSENETAHYFGLRIARAVAGISMDLSRYGTWAGADAAAPAGPDFAVRLGLRWWDTENSIPLARGWVRWKFFGGEAGSAEGADAQVTIK